MRQAKLIILLTLIIILRVIKIELLKKYQKPGVQKLSNSFGNNLYTSSKDSEKYNGVINY